MLTSKEPILVSGGDGFIGKNIVKRLLELGIPVIVIDNHVTSYPNIQSEHVKRFEEDVSTVDVSDVPTVSGVIHLASVASPLVYLKNPSLVLDPNTIGTRKMIEIAKRDKVRILFASTSEVYGNLNEDILGNRGIKENDNAFVSLLSNRSCYAAAKRLGEELIWNFKKEGGDASIFRLFNVYGPGMDLKNTGYGRVIPNFIHNMLQEMPIQIFGDGTQIRSFLWIDDAVDAILSLFFFENELPDVLNIGNDEPITILDLASKISDILEVTYKTKYCDREEDDPLWRRPCIEKINKLTDWEPEINLDEGLRRTVLAKKH